METFTILLLLFITGIITVFLISPEIKRQLKIRQLDKIGRNIAGTRPVLEILAEVNWHNEQLLKCQAELNQILMSDTDLLKDTLKMSEPTEEPKQFKIVFNSKEIACRYQDMEIPKYMKTEEGNWYEFEGLAHYDSENRMIVDDASKNYITINDTTTNSNFLFKQLENAPILKNENEDRLLES